MELAGIAGRKGFGTGFQIRLFWMRCALIVTLKTGVESQLPAKRLTMDQQPLVCNAKNCRTELRDKAIVTVCWFVAVSSDLKTHHSYPTVTPSAFSVPETPESTALVR